MNAAGIKTAATPSDIGSTLVERIKEEDGLYEKCLTVK